MDSGEADAAPRLRLRRARGYRSVEVVAVPRRIEHSLPIGREADRVDGCGIGLRGYPAS